jgi:hypothetical protein
VRALMAHRIGSDDRLDFLDKFHHLEVWDHCNGLLRVNRMVVNHATMGLETFTLINLKKEKKIIPLNFIKI